MQLKEQIKRLEDQSAMYEQSVVNYFEKEKERRTQDVQQHSLNIICKPDGRQDLSQSFNGNSNKKRQRPVSFYDHYSEYDGPLNYS